MAAWKLTNWTKWDTRSLRALINTVARCEAVNLADVVGLPPIKFDVRSDAAGQSRVHRDESFVRLALPRIAHVRGHLDPVTLIGSITKIGSLALRGAYYALEQSPCPLGVIVHAISVACAALRERFPARSMKACLPGMTRLTLKEARERPAPPRAPITARRLERAKANLARWERKLRFAQNKIKKLTREVRRREKK